MHHKINQLNLRTGILVKSVYKNHQLVISVGLDLHIAHKPVSHICFVFLSRLSFGVVTACRAVLVVDSCVPEPARLQRLLGVASNALSEQFSSLEEFNVIRFVDRHVLVPLSLGQCYMCILPSDVQMV